MEKPTHRETCRAVARILLQEPWADAVCWEVGVQDSTFDILAVTGATAEERQRRKIQGWESRAACGFKERPPRPPDVRVLVGEVKMSRSDLQAGIRRGQLEQYLHSRAKPSHLLLVVWEGALRRSGDGPWLSADTDAALADLSMLGVPDFWGVARVRATPEQRAKAEAFVIRRPQRMNDGGSLVHRIALAEKMARSLAYRVLSQTSPEME
jgi:hypothetical protein